MTRNDGRPRSVAITLPLDPMPWLNTSTQIPRRKARGDRYDDMFRPRPGYSQRIEDYA